MSRLTRDGAAEPVSRDQILRRERGQGNFHFPCSADHVQDWQPYPVDPCSCYMCDHTSPQEKHSQNNTQYSRRYRRQHVLCILLACSLLQLHISPSAMHQLLYCCCSAIGAHRHTRPRSLETETSFAASADSWFVLCTVYYCILYTSVVFRITINR